MTIPLQNILELAYINKLKNVYRFAHVDNRHESTAEHSWGTLIVADFILSYISEPLNRLRVFELLMYHDIVEIEAGDTPLIPGQKNTNKKERELQASREVKTRLPSVLQKKYGSLFSEFESAKTREAKLAKVIDALEADIHELDYKDDWKGWTVDYYNSKRALLFKEFHELTNLYKDFLAYLIDNQYLTN